MLSTMLWDVIEFSMRLSAELASTTQTLSEAGSAGEARPSTLTGAQPKPLRPRGAAGLGGTYYRGNDERNEKLFNGGYYRTAVMKLSLIDENDQPLTLGQTVSNSQLFVRLEIERARQAASMLFTDELMTAVLLSRNTGDRKEPLAGDEPAHFAVLESGERWEAKYRLGDFTGQTELALNGTIYVYTGG